MTFHDIEQKTEAFVLSHWHTFFGGVVIGAISGWILHAVV